ncbi:MAG: YlbF family regulator [Planctomycetaceae bacterium]|nr:YlbF family regulator [Planctomycetaceae bacterium]
MSAAIVELAKRLGKAIGESKAFADLKTAEQALHSEPGTEDMLRQFQTQSNKVAELEEQNKPVEVEDKHKLQELHGKLVASAAFKKLTAAQVEYTDLMRQVNEAIHEGMGEE